MFIPVCYCNTLQFIFLFIGLTRNQIAKIFSHCVYDGVYATAEERVRGGGSLSLKTKFAIWLGLPEDEFNGCWDLGHNLQLVYSDALRKNKQFKKFNTMMYKYMQNNKFGQSGCRFREVSDNLLQPILSNKSAQETRWIRAELRCIQTFLRNLPVFVHIQEQEVEKLSKIQDLAGMKKAESQLKELKDPNNIAFAVGLCDLLNDYADLSLVGQDILKFPSTVSSRYETLKQRLSELGKKWVWRDENLEMAEIGNPKEIIDNLYKGKYKCEVSRNVKNATARRLNVGIKENNRINAEMSKLNKESLENQHDLILPEDIVEGEFSVIPKNKLIIVKKRLRKLSINILTSMEE